MKSLIKWRHQYDREADEREGEASILACLDPSLTQQHFTDDANINVIAARFGITDIPLHALDPNLFRDTTNDPELRDVLDAQHTAREYFMALPAKMRRRFHDSPQELWDYVNDPENHEEAIRLGILAKAPTPEDGARSAQQHGSTGTASPPGTAPTTDNATPTSPPEGTPQTSQKGT